MDAYRVSGAAALERGESDKTKFLDALGEMEEIVDVLRNFGPRAEEESAKAKVSEGEAEERTAVAAGKWQMQARDEAFTVLYGQGRRAYPKTARGRVCDKTSECSTISTRVRCQKIKERKKRRECYCNIES